MHKQSTLNAATASTDGDANKAYITHKELSRYFGVNRATVTEWKKKGMPYMNMKPEAKRDFCRFNVEEVEAWLKRRAHSGKGVEA